MQEPCTQSYPARRGQIREKSVQRTVGAVAIGIPGKHNRFSMPSTMEDAIKMAVTVEQAEACDRRNDSFYVNQKPRITHYPSLDAESDEQGNSAPSANHQGRNTRGPEAPKCFECGGVVHWAQVCANRLARTATS
jgi:hypothetical protein